MQGTISTEWLQIAFVAMGAGCACLAFYVVSKVNESKSEVKLYLDTFKIELERRLGEAATERARDRQRLDTLEETVGTISTDVKQMGKDYAVIRGELSRLRFED